MGEALASIKTDKFHVKISLMNSIKNKPAPHSKDLRKGRYSQANQTYLLTTVTYQRQTVFSDFHLGRLVVHAIRKQHQLGNIDSLAFVVMPDHLHWLCTLQGDNTLANVMHQVKGNSACQIQKIRRERGLIPLHQPLWQDGYHDHALRKEEDLQQVARYIVANPLRAKLVANIGNYPLWDAIWL